MYRKLGFVTLVFVMVASGLYGFIATAQQMPTPTPTAGMSDMGDMETEFTADELAPLVRGIYKGEEVLFIHTEASDPDVADMLTAMMGPQVIHVPGLSEVSEELLGNVYVFTNGVEGGGPMGFQADIFDSIPGDEDYTPLRQVNLVTWQKNSTPQALSSVDDIDAAEAADEVMVEQPGIVVNMSILVWPGGHR